MIAKGASLLGKAAEFVAGKAVEVFEWAKGFASEILAILRNALKGALKLFEGLANKLVDAFDAMKALFETESTEASAQKALTDAAEKVAGDPVPGATSSGASSAPHTTPAKPAAAPAQTAKKEATVTNIEDARRKRELAAQAKARAKPAVVERKIAVGAENQPTVAQYGDDEISEHITEQTQHHGSGDQLNHGDVPPENVRDRPNIRATEYDPWVGDSKLLGQRLGPPPGPGYEAHHIVPSGEAESETLRTFLKDRGWKDINDADNGVWLPRGSQTENVTGSFRHEFTFDSEHLGDNYFRRLEEILMKDPKITSNGIRLKLRGIASYLRKGEFPPSNL